MKNKYINKIVQGIVMFSALFTISCQDFLTEDPQYIYTAENVFTSSSQVDQVLVGCYDKVRGIYVPYVTAMTHLRGNGTDQYDVASIRVSLRKSDYSTLSSETSDFKTTYNNFYNLISKANLALYAADLSHVSWVDEDEKNYAKAQAKFFRAYAYYCLGSLYDGVPIVDTVQTEARYDYVRASQAETFQFAISDLESALDYLPETSTQNGRIVKGAAQHYLALLYLDLGASLDEDGDSSGASAAYTSSIAYADQLINGSTYKLMTERFGTRSTEDPVYYFADEEAYQTPDRLYSAAGIEITGNVIWDMWQDGNIDYQDGNLETIWAIQIDYDAHKIDTDARLRWSEVFGGVFRDPQSGVCDGMMEDVGGRGVAYAQPTKYATETVWEGDYADDLRNAESVMRRRFLGNNVGNEWLGKEIPWDVLYKLDGTTYTADQTEAAYTQVHPVSIKIHTDQYQGLEDGENRSDLFRDEPMARLAETVLIRAEAKWRNGDNSGAASDINLLRNRAQCSYLVTAADVCAELILDERTRELMFEEKRWFTLFRFGGVITASRIKEYTYWDYPRTTLNFDVESWPIPQDIIDTNKDVVMDQNYGW